MPRKRTLYRGIDTTDHPRFGRTFCGCCWALVSVSLDRREVAWECDCYEYWPHCYQCGRCPEHCRERGINPTVALLAV